MAQDPAAGVTHDVVAWVNASTPVGLTVLPNTYRVRQAPTFLPRMSSGPPAGHDLSRWKSWSQVRFDGGAGQIKYSGPQGNNRYAISHLVDIGLPLSVGAPLVGRRPGSEDEAGTAQAAIVPKATTGEAAVGALFTNTHKVFFLEHSSRPHAFHRVSAVTYTNISDAGAFTEGALEGYKDALTGVWAVINTGIPEIKSAVRFSSIVALGVGNQGIRVYGSSDGVAPSVVYEPGYSTNADLVGGYDAKLWRAEGSRVAFYDLDTLEWSSFHHVGDPGTDINSMKQFNGKYYFGKEDELQVFDQGRIYAVHEFEDERDPSNCLMLVEHRGSLYYNVGSSVYRLSGGGLIEKLATPIVKGAIIGGTSVGDELHILTKTVEGESEIWIYTPETGGTRRWFNTGNIMFKIQASSDLERAASGIAGVLGHLWLGPVNLSATYHSIGSAGLAPIVSANRFAARDQIVRPGYAKTHSYLITSLLDFGLPAVEKFIDRVIIDYDLQTAGTRLDVSYAKEVRTAQVESVLFADDGGAFTDITDTVTDGDLESSEEITGTFTTFYIGFKQPVPSFRIIVGENAGSMPFSNVAYSTPSGFQDAITSAGTSVPPFGVDTGQIAFTPDRNLDKDIRAQVIDLPDWVEDEVDGNTAYWIKYDTGNPLAISFTLDIAEIGALVELERIDWKLLGSITDLDSSRKELAFDPVLSTKDIILRFDLWGNDISRPDLRGITIKWLEDLPDKEIHNFSVVAVNKLKRLDGEIEHSGLHVAASLWSMTKGGSLHTVEVPWPPPVGHTIRARVSVPEPGARVPILQYKDTFSGAIIPVQVDEL